MIKGVHKIKGLGVFENFNGDLDASDFGIKNLIYGWNYSGKTTLSRIFALLESKQPNSELPDFSFTLDTDRGLVTEANFHASPHIVRVFNSDFISRNLNFSGDPFAPILLLGADSGDAQKELIRCESMLDRARKGIEKCHKTANDIESAFSKNKTINAAATKATLSLVSAYTATHLEKDIASVRAGDFAFELSQSGYDSDLKLARTSDQDRPPTVSLVSLALNLNELHAKAIPLLSKTPDLSNTIQHLVKNPPVESWVETGLAIHAGKETCEFCGGDLTKHRLAELQSHFSEDLALHKEEVQRLLTEVESAPLQFTSRKDIEFNAQFRPRFNSAQGKLIDAVKAYNQAAAALAKELRIKQKDAFTPIQPRDLREL